MATVNHHRLPHADGHNGDTHLTNLGPAANGHEVSDLDLWGDEEALRRELELLAAENEQLRCATGLDAPADQPPAAADAPAAGDDSADLRAENAALRARVEELENLLLETTQQREHVWSEQQREYEALLEEKSEVIHTLHLKIQELKEAADAPPPASEPADLSAGDDLDPVALRAQLERERRQLQEDEEALMEQMKQMEMAMSRERVEVARQRSELQRLHNDFQHELEMAARDGNLRERLLPLQRRHQEIVNSRGAQPSKAATPAGPAAQPGPSTPTPAPKKGGSGLFRRLFRKGGD